MVYDAYNITISGFTIQNSNGVLMQGLMIWDAGYNEVFDNIFKNNYIGLNLKSDSSNNIIHHNSFIDNTYNAIDYNDCTDSENQWDDSSEGNYWDDYIGEDVNGDGIGDTPYTIQGPYDCQDEFPLVESSPSSNNPPNTPYNPTPQNGKTSVNIDQDLYWSGDDPDGDSVTYDIYFGKTSPPEIKISNQSATSYDQVTMNYDTKYYWKIIAWDNHGNSSAGPIWSFTTGSQPSGGGGGEETPGGGPFIPPSKTPTANASASGNTGFINTAITFDGSYSYDEDGEITNYTWDFGDSSYGYDILTTHIYEEAKVYNVKLTVIDNTGISDTDSFKVVIKQQNDPPSIPQIEGPSDGKQNIEYNFTVFSTDLNNDKIQYIFNWGDGLSTETDFLSNGTVDVQEHIWTTAGIFKIKVVAIDSNYASSDSTDITILIDVLYCKDIGYFIDDNSDGIYDTLYSNTTKLTTDVIYEEGDYLIDIDGDGIDNYIYNYTNDALTKIETPDKNEKTGEVNDMTFVIIILVIVILIVLILIANRHKQKVNVEKKGKKKVKREKETKEKETKKEETKLTPKEKPAQISKKDKTKSIESEVDDLLKKKKN